MGRRNPHRPRRSPAPYRLLFAIVAVACYVGWQAVHSTHAPARTDLRVAGKAAPGSAGEVDRISAATGLSPSAHFVERLGERGITADEVIAAVQSGQVFYDPRNDSTIHWKDGVYIAVAANGTIKTAIRGPIEGRWVAR